MPTDYNNLSFKNDFIGIKYPCAETEDALLISILSDEKPIELIIEDIIFSSGGYIQRRAWQSKYNKYVVYDNEPFCSQGFYREFYLPDTKTSQFIAELIILHTSKITRLEKQLQLETEVNN